MWSGGAIVDDYTAVLQAFWVGAADFEDVE